MRKSVHKILLLPVILVFPVVLSFAQEERTRYFPKQVERPKTLPERKNVWVFILAGQSNMAGRGLVEPSDTISDTRILTMDDNKEIVLAKEPLHFYEPKLTGLDCGLSFGKQLIKDIDPSITILLVPTAVGGSSSHQWLGDSLHRNVKLLSNFRNRIEVAKKYGIVRGILWHQGESDTDPKHIPGYEERLQKLFTELRSSCGNTTLPILVGELGSYAENQVQWKLINEAIHRYAEKDMYVTVINTQDLNSKDDKIHFNSEGQRAMGKRMAKAFVALERKRK